jgi:hypothetical protein
VDPASVLKVFIAGHVSPISWLAVEVLLEGDVHYGRGDMSAEAAVKNTDSYGWSCR